MQPDAQKRSTVSTILVVDDEGAIREVIREYLTLMEYSVTLAENGEEALRQLHESSFDLVISDVMMPKMNGLDLVRHLRTDRWTAQQVILLTGSDIDGMNLPADKYTRLLKKPFSFDNLLEMIRTTNNR